MTRSNLITKYLEHYNHESPHQVPGEFFFNEVYTGLKGVLKSGGFLLGRKELFKMKDKILTLFYMVAYYMGIFKCMYFFSRNEPTIVTYHNVLPDSHFEEDLLHLGVSCQESAFYKQLEVINRRFSVVTDYVDVKYSCLITFDDGYRNNFLVAVPSLESFGCKGVFFVPSCYYEGKKILWVDKLLMWTSYVPIGVYKILSLQFNIANKKDRFSLWGYIYESTLKDFNLVDKVLIETEAQYSYKCIIQSIDAALYDIRFTGLISSELDEMKKWGHKIACHSYDHPILSSLTTQDLNDDFERCDQFRGEYNSNFYSYPFGGVKEVSQREKKLVERKGYSRAFVNYDVKNEGPYWIGRISLGNLMNKYRIEAKLCGFEKLMKQIFK